MYAFLSSQANKKIIEALKERGMDVILLSPFEKLAEPVSSHADMLMFAFENTLFLPVEYKFSGLELLKEKFNIIYINDCFGEKYPNDVLLNIALVGDCVFANTKYASAEVLEYLKGQGKRIYHISQGYAHCSTCIVSENAIITADKGIAVAARSAGAEVLLISEGNISLPPYNSGFIGGASGADSENVYFCGSLSSHPDGDKIADFCLSQGKTPISLCDTELFDIGGIFFVN